MTRFFLVYLVYFLVSSSIQAKKNVISETTSLEQRSGIDGRIVNGTLAYSGQFPTLVSLRRTWSGSHFCGGTFIHERWILTAGHCMFLNKVAIKPWTISVVGGEEVLYSYSELNQESLVRKIIIHQNFSLATLFNDIALLEMENPLVPTDAVQLAILPTGPTEPGTFCFIAGWGYPDHESKYVSTKLLYIELPLLTQKMCRKLLAKVSTVPDGMICAGYLKGGKDSCQGDSGGGMICNGYLAGVVSGGNGCAKPKTPGVYSDTFFYKKWIISTMKATSIYNDMYANGASNNFINVFWIVSFAFFTILTVTYY